MENAIDRTAKGAIEITDDLSTVKTIISELVVALNSGKKSRQRSLVVTKLEEARMWCEEAQMHE